MIFRKSLLPTLDSHIREAIESPHGNNCGPRGAKVNEVCGSACAVVKTKPALSIVVWGPISFHGRVRLKDLIELETAQGKYEYEVLPVAVVDPNQIEVLESSNQSELTLVTCYPFHYVGAAAQGLVVRSTRVAAH